MLTIQGLTSLGVFFRIQVEQVEFEVVCRYCRQSFLTINVNQVFCMETHRVYFNRDKQCMGERRLTRREKRSLVFLNGMPPLQ